MSRDEAIVDVVVSFLCALGREDGRVGDEREKTRRDVTT